MGIREESIEMPCFLKNAVLLCNQGIAVSLLATIRTMAFLVPLPSLQLSSMHVYNKVLSQHWPKGQFALVSLISFLPPICRDFYNSRM